MKKIEEALRNIKSGKTAVEEMIKWIVDAVKMVLPNM